MINLYEVLPVVAEEILIQNILNSKIWLLIKYSLLVVM